MNGNTLYAWQELNDDGWGIIAAINPLVGDAPVPLVTRSPSIADKLEPFAHGHHISSGNPIRLGRFEFAAAEQETP